MKKSVNKLLEESFRNNWDCQALSDYKGQTMTYGELAVRIAKLHIVFEACGVQKGDKIAICSRNQANWAVCFLSAMTFGAVPVPILHEFKPSNIHHLVNHSDAKVLFAGSIIIENLMTSEMPEIEALIKIEDLSTIYYRNPEVALFREQVDLLFKVKYPDGFTQDSIKYYEDTPDELAVINYTSGTSGFSKGVMLPYRSIYSNILFAMWAEPNMNNSSNVVSMLPTAHMYGLMFEFIFEMTVGAHVHFLTRLPSPKVILDAMSEIKPDVIIAVPLIIEKIYKSVLLPHISKKRTKMFLSIPVIDQVVQKKIQQGLIDAFGGRFSEVIVGGAAFNREAEAFLKRINFPFTVGYGMTECGPIITYVPWRKTRLYSCGKAAPRMEIKIDSEDPKNVPGEVLVKGDNVFLGYYKNPQATEASFTKGGWFKTGDMGVIDSHGYLYLKGRCKSMILGSSGQNIYPEEIEGSLNNLPYVVESLVIEDKGVLTALIYPDYQQAEEDNLDDERLLKVLNEEVQFANLEFPNYCKVSNVEIFPEEFEKTPKRSIKRYLYQR